MKVIIYSIIIVILIILICVIFTYKTQESFDAYNNHYLKAKQLYPNITELEMKYNWSLRDKDGTQLYDVVYENLDHLDYIDNEAIQLGGIKVISDNVAVPFNGNLIHMSQKNYNHI